MDCCDYIGATGINPTIDYVDTQIYNTSNILESHIYNTSNILESHIYETSNILHTYTDTSITILDNKYNKLIKEQTEQEIINGIPLNLKNTYITNSNLGGQIKFYMNNIIDCNVPVFIDREGYLQVYYKYNGLINLIEGSGYKNIVNEISSSKSGINLLGGFVGTLQLETAGIIAYLIKNRPQNEIGELLEVPAFSMTSSYTAITSALNNISVRLQNILFNNNFTLFLGTPVAVGLFAAAQAFAHNDAAQIIGQAIIKQYNSNLQLTTIEKQDLLTYGSNLYAENINKFISYTSNLNVISGFINSNITTAQTIPNIKTSTITINNTGSATYSLINFSNATNNSSGYIGLGGIVSGYHNNNMIYNSSGGGSHIFNVSGQSSLSIPAFSINNSACVGININPSAYPLYRFSVAGDVYIHNAALRTNSIIYNGEELSTTLTNYLLKAGGTMYGRIVFNTGYYQDPSPTGFGDRIVLQSGGLGYAYSVGINTDVFWHSAPATASYKFYSGATNTATLNNVGLLTVPTINATTSITTPSIIYNGTELSTTVGNYLLKSGGTMTGQLAITANSASSLISLTNTHTIGQGILQTNNLGGYARLTYYNSGAGGYYTGNYVLEASSNSAAIVMNTGGNTSNSIPRFILNSSGNIGIGISNPSAKLEVNGKIGCIGILNCWSNVGIGVTDPYSQLHVRGTNPNLIIMGQGGTGATSTINLSPSDTLTNAASCSLIATDDGAYGATFQIKQKLSGANTNGQFTSLILNVDGNVGIGSTTITGIKLYVNGKTRFTDVVTFPNSIWHKSVDNIERFYYDISGTSYFHSGNSGTPFIFRSYAQADIFTISNTGDIAGNAGTFGGNIDCGGCLFLTGANSIYNPGGATVDSGNYSNTYLTFKANVAGNDWCHIRQVGSDNFFKLTLDFHDDGDDARFCIRNVKSTDTPDTITEVFSVNNGNVACTGNLIVNDITRSRNYFNFGTTLNYQASYNGYNAGGWYFPLNQFWDGYSTASYIHIAITCLGINAVWCGRALVGQGGGLYFLTNEFRTPTGTNQIDVYDIWGGSYNALRITINNGTYGGQFNIKISG